MHQKYFIFEIKNNFDGYEIDLTAEKIDEEIKTPSPSNKNLKKYRLKIHVFKLPIYISKFLNENVDFLLKERIIDLSN